MRKAISLGKVAQITILPTSPFDFDSTFHKPDHFTTGDNKWQPGIRWQTWNWLGKSLGLKFVNEGTRSKPKIIVEVYDTKKLDTSFIKSLKVEIEYRYNLKLDLTDFYDAHKSDKVLGPIIKKWKGMRPGHPSSLYEYLIIGVVLQNATVKRSVQMFQVLIETYGKLLEYDEHNLPAGRQGLWSFPKPGGLQNVSEDDLRALKVGYRAKSIKKLDDYFYKKLIDEFELREKDFDTQKEELLKLYGVGPATVWYLLFDVFHHWEYFDHISPWEQKIYSKLFFDKDPEKPVSVKKILKYIGKYGKYKQLAVHYIWEDLWWTRKNKSVPWLEKLIRV